MHDPALLDCLARSRSIVVLSGAGMSAESGVPTFRDAQSGYWSRFRPEELATPAAFERDPALVWRWYQERRETVRGVEPNAGHVALAKADGDTRRVIIVTQNVDGLHQRAGSRNVIELHGNLFVNRCFVEQIELVSECIDTATEPPRCGGCGGPVRPGVVWFGEALPSAAFAAAEAAVAAADVLLSVGTSSLVYPAAGFAEQALGAGIPVVEINPAETPLSPYVNFRVAEPAALALPSLLLSLDPEGAPAP